GVIPTDQVDVPHRAVIELPARIRHVLQDVERRLLVEDRRVETLALRTVSPRPTIDERDQTFARTAPADERSCDIDVVCTAIPKRHISKTGRVGHVFYRCGTECGCIKGSVVDALVFIAAIGLG